MSKKGTEKKKVRSKARRRIATSRIANQCDRFAPEDYVIQNTCTGDCISSGYLKAKVVRRCSGCSDTTIAAVETPWLLDVEPDDNATC